MKKLSDTFKALFWFVFIVATGVIVIVKLLDYLKKNRPDLMEQIEDKVAQLEEVIPQIENAVAEVSEPLQDRMADVRRTVTKDARTAAKSVNKSVKQVKNAVAELTDRQEALLKFIQKYEKATMAAFKEEIKGVTDRTLRRDLAKLESAKLISKHGSTKSAYYKAR